ncbi:ascorbate oxidase [Drechmeria coniospora]|uniref:Ascorbate oxidase n=1 Tax=Drechmeria coniospora TaxID=98403 RepID=A0A151GUM2_DRECN|nr:ascorbate oxidase [Drechmeria coniospora]KYK60778.1 ascorbate oxidase [Drechmeria coniospora]
MRRPLLLLLAHCLLATAASLVTHGGQFVPDHVLRVSSADIAIACERRRSAVVNGTVPGPTLRILAGRRTWIRVYNDMPKENLTMHWHGLAQRMAIFSDGSPQGSQWPIPPGHFFDYELHTTSDDAGTYFYHSHVGMQALTASGPLVVEDCRPPPFRYDDERILHWSDYFRQDDAAFEAGLTAVPFVFGGESQGVLLNGKGVALGREGAEGPLGSECSLPVIDVEPGRTYRFRFIGSTGLSLVSIAFEGHVNLHVVQADAGAWTRPVWVDRIQLGSGQRFDAIFKAKTAEELRKAGGKMTYVVQYETRDRPSVYRGYAVLRYANGGDFPGRPATPPLRIPEKTNAWLEYQLQPLYPGPRGHPTLAEVTRRVVMNSSQLVDPRTGQVVWRLAGLSWTDNAARTPLLVDIYKRGDAAMPSYDDAVRNGGWDPRTKAFPVKVGEVIEIVLQNTGSLKNGGSVDVHPFHAHGQHFYDLGSGDGLYDAAANEAKVVAMGYKAVERDTTMLHRYSNKTEPGAPAGWRVWRLRVEQPGVWLLHCHTLQHMMMGMQSAWVVGSADQIRNIPFHYAQGYLEYGGDAYGNSTHEPTAMHEFDDAKPESCPGQNAASQRLDDAGQDAAGQSPGKGPGQNAASQRLDDAGQDAAGQSPGKGPGQNAASQSPGKGPGQNAASQRLDDAG